MGEFKCPICNREFKVKNTLISHIFTFQEEQHIKLKDSQLKMIEDLYYSNLSAADVSKLDGCLVSFSFICEKWREKPDNKERKRRLFSSKKLKSFNYLYNVCDKVPEDVYRKILSFYQTTETYQQIADKLNCCPKLIKNIFYKEFKNANKRAKEVQVKNCGGKGFKEKNKELYTKILNEFNSNDPLSVIASRLNITLKTIKKYWSENFGKEEILNREERLFGKLVECPVCKIKGSKTRISAHIMNSYNEPAHNIFIKEQDNRIRNLYQVLPLEELRIILFAERDDIFCSPAYIRKIFKTFGDYKEKIKKIRSFDTSNQFKDGRRTEVKGIIPGRKPERGKDLTRYMSEEKYNIICEMFYTDLQQNEISKQIDCKAETINKIWKENFTESELVKRLHRTWNFNKPTEEQIEKIKVFFDKNYTFNEIAKKLEIGQRHVARLCLDVYGEEKYKERVRKNKQRGILRSLKTLGDAGQAGSKPEICCFNMLSQKLDCEVIHHDFDVVPPYEIDITIPCLKVAIAWDGVFHRRPIFNEERLAEVKKRDERKREILKEAGWKYIVIEDDQQKLNEQLISKTVEQIILSIDSPNNYVVIKNDS